MEQVRRLRKLGHRASHTAELRFEDCRIPAENLLGGEDKLEHKLEKARRGEGKPAALGTFEQTRPMVAAMALGVARASFEYACSYAREREAFGGPIIGNQGVSFPLADLAADIDAARLLTWRASWMAANGVPFQAGEGSMSKLKASEVAVRAAEQAVQTCGGWGYVDDLPVEKWYRDAKLYTIFEGTSEIQRMVIGRTLTDPESTDTPAAPPPARRPGRREPEVRARLARPRPRRRGVHEAREEGAGLGAAARREARLPRRVIGRASVAATLALDARKAPIDSQRARGARDGVPPPGHRIGGPPGS